MIFYTLDHAGGGNDSVHAAQNGGFFAHCEYFTGFEGCVSSGRNAFFVAEFDLPLARKGPPLGCLRVFWGNGLETAPFLCYC